MKHSLDLYPPVTIPTFPPTWADVESLAPYYPQVRHAAILVDRGDWTREQALIMLLFIYIDTFQRMFTAEVERRNRELPTAIVVRDCPICGWRP